MAKIATLVDQVDSGTILLPQFQREFVWTRAQVAKFMRSLYLGYPVGSLLTWETTPDPGLIRGHARSGTKLLLLDGQQRLTSIYAILHGRVPEFFDGDPSLFSGLHFNLLDESFSFAPQLLERRGMWVNVTDTMRNGPGQYIDDLHKWGPNAATLLNRLTQLTHISDREIHNEVLTGEHYDTATVVDIFNQANSAGTPLSKGDLAIASLCVKVPDARRNVQKSLYAIADAGWKLGAGDYLPALVAIATGRVGFEVLNDVSAADLRTAFESSPKYIRSLMSTLRDQLAVHPSEVLFGIGAIPVLSTALHLAGGVFDSVMAAQAVYWYVLSGILRRYEGAAELTLNHDLALLEADRFNGLFAAVGHDSKGLRAVIGDLLRDPRRRALALQVLRLLTRVTPGKDLVTGQTLRTADVQQSLRTHLVFPKIRLHDLGLPASYIDDVANYCFVTSKTSSRLRGVDPHDCYLHIPDAEDVLRSQNLPCDPDLWRFHKYPEFLDARRELLSSAIERFINTLATAAAVTVPSDPTESKLRAVPNGTSAEQEIRIRGVASA